MAGVPLHLGFLVLISLLVPLTSGKPALGREAAKPQQKQEQTERDRAIEFCRENRDLEALPLLKKVYEADPSDLQIKELLACAMISAASLEPKEKQVEPLVKARKMLVEIKEKRELSDLGEVLLSLVPPDGKMAVSEQRKEVVEAMDAGQQAFARRDFAKARAGYQLAVKLDPKNYDGVLFVGDSWFAEGKMDEAVAWFDRAVKLDPNRAIGYRYWGDALLKQGKNLEARDKFLNAVVAEPYSRPPWVTLGSWARQNSIQLSHPKVLPPDPKPGEPREAAIDDGTIHVVVYDALRQAWKEKLFKQTFPKEPAYRNSLAEEFDTLHRLAQAVEKGSKAGEIKTPHPALANLVKLDREGLLEAYILIARPDEGVAQDYEAYREKHRDKLLRYLSEYVAPKPAANAIPENLRKP